MSTGPGRLQRRALALVEAAEGRTMSRRELESVMVAEGYDKGNVYRGLHDRRLVRLREGHTLDESRVSAPEPVRMFSDAEIARILEEA